MKGFVLVVLFTMFAPIVVLSMAASFVQWDIALLNPSNWKEGVRFISAGWVILIGTLAVANYLEAEL